MLCFTAGSEHPAVGSLKVVWAGCSTSLTFETDMKVRESFWRTGVWAGFWGLSRSLLGRVEGGISGRGDRVRENTSPGPLRTRVGSRRRPEKTGRVCDSWRFLWTPYPQILGNHGWILNKKVSDWICILKRPVWKLCGERFEEGQGWKQSMPWCCGAVSKVPG